MTNQQIISIDWFNGKDCTVVSSICGHCKNVLEIYREDIRLQNGCKSCVYKECPICGIEFKCHTAVEEH